MPARLGARIRGPVQPIPPAFTAGGDLDCEAVERYCAGLVDEGATVLMVTAGTSRLNLLDDAEVRALNAAVVRGAAGRAVTIVANPAQGATRHAAAFAEHAARIGASALLLYYPERYYDDDAVVAYFRETAAAAPVPLLLHAMPMRSGTGGLLATEKFSLALCRRLAELPQFIGMKEEQGDAGLQYRLAAELGGRLAFVVAGGGMRAFLGCHAFGVQAHLTGVGSFRPRIEAQFHALVEQRRLDEALAMVTAIEQPLFDVAVPMGWHRAMRGLLAVLGLMPAHERAPLAPCTAAELAQLSALARRLGWLA